MGKTLSEIAEELKECDKKVQLIYAFNGTGKTRLSREFKKLVQPSDAKDIETDSMARDTILYYNAFTEDLFYWDNDLEKDTDRKLIVQSNSFIDWIIFEQGQDQSIIEHFQHYTDNKLVPKFELPPIKDEKGETIGYENHVEAISFSYQRGNEDDYELVKISKGEESNFIWSIFYSLIENVVDILNVVEDRETDEFDKLKYIFIDDPVSSLDENHLIETAVDLGTLIKSSESDVKFILTTHNPLFYNVLHNEFNKAKKYFLKRLEDGTFELKEQSNDSPFSYHLTLLEELHHAIKVNEITKYHFNFLRNLLEKTSTFLGYKNWTSLLPEDSRKAYESRIINISSHSKYTTDEIAEANDQEKQMLKYLVELLEDTYKFNKEQ
ncbi:anticodon nuclease [Lactococcus lactis subsp. lactis]|uniref:AAA family ATPase n=1 Tax=Lactococcus lactis TaxID=1358 RepID=UPI00223C4FF9|nr:AAA family ATPase [Lactococcus lactis]MCT0017112.1 anticodon nuclease [Lactococcus lactis subsp. lactis]